MWAFKAEELKDEEVAPETAKFIKDLQAELQASVEAKDVFDRAIDAYSKSWCQSAAYSSWFGDD